jgi:predicted RNase H-like HicB family nuclease
MDIQVAIHKDEETGSYWASVVQLPGCYAAGRTRGELMEALSEAISLYLEEAEPAQMVEKVELKRFRFNKSGLVPA